MVNINDLVWGEEKEEKISPHNPIQIFMSCRCPCGGGPIVNNVCRNCFRVFG